MCIHSLPCLEIQCPYEGSIELGANCTQFYAAFITAKAVGQCVKKSQGVGASTYSDPIWLRPTLLIFQCKMLGSRTSAIGSPDLLYIKRSLEEAYAHSSGFHYGRPLLESLMSCTPTKYKSSAHSHLNKRAPKTVDDGDLSLVNKHQHWPPSSAP